MYMPVLSSLIKNYIHYFWRERVKKSLQQYLQTFAFIIFSDICLFRINVPNIIIPKTPSYITRETAEKN